MSIDSHKFASMIISECQRQTVLTQQKPMPSDINVSAYKTCKNTAPVAKLGTMLLGVFALLAACIALFDGPMVPAMWQLTSVIWLVWRILKTDTNSLQ